MTEIQACPSLVLKLSESSLAVLEVLFVRFQLSALNLDDFFLQSDLIGFELLNLTILFLEFILPFEVGPVLFLQILIFV